MFAICPKYYFVFPTVIYSLLHPIRIVQSAVSIYMYSVDIVYPAEYREKSSESRADGEGDIVRGRDVFHGTFLHILWRLRSYIITAFRKAELASNVTAPFLFSEAPNIVCGGCAVVKQAGPCQDDRNLFGPLPFGRPHPLPAERRRPQYRASVKRRVRDPNRT